MKPDIIKNTKQLNYLLKEHAIWSDKTFGDTGVEPPLKHLLEEVQEVIDQPSDDAEWGDCFLLLLDASRRSGRSFDKLVKCAVDKLEICRNRKWKKMANGIHKHVKKYPKSVCQCEHDLEDVTKWSHDCPLHKKFTR